MTHGCLSKKSRGVRRRYSASPCRSCRPSKRAASSLVDELEASLHPALAQQIVRQFNDPATNPGNAQLIFTTHDTNLLGTTLGEPALRRDQVWLTEKDNEGATVLYPLTDYKPRKAENIERGYLQGRYGAIPFLGDFHWPEEVGDGRGVSRHAKPSPRPHRRPGRRSPFREPRPIILIVCEGERTEREYFEGFARACRTLVKVRDRPRARGPEDTRDRRQGAQEEGGSRTPSGRR